MKHYRWWVLHLLIFKWPFTQVEEVWQRWMVKNMSTWVIFIHPAALCSMHYAAILITDTCSIVMSTNDKIYHNLAARAKPATDRESVLLGCKAISHVLSWRYTVYLHCERERKSMHVQTLHTCAKEALGETGQKMSRRDGYVIVVTWVL